MNVMLNICNARKVEYEVGEFTMWPVIDELKKFEVSFESGSE